VPKIRLSRQSILGIVLVYAAFSALWVMVSEQVSSLLVQDRALRQLVDTLSGWLFITLTSLLLYGLLLRVSRSERPITSGSSGHPLRLPVVLLALATVAVSGAGIFYTVGQAHQEEIQRLEIISDLKLQHIVDWLQEARTDAELIRHNPEFIELFRRWRSSGDPHDAAQLQQRLTEFAAIEYLGAVTLLDSSGGRLWGSEQAPPVLLPSLLAVAQEVAQRQEIRLFGPYLGQRGNLRLDILTPLAVAGEWPVVVIHLDPSEWLFNTLHQWPLPSHSGESLLVRRDGDQVLFLNELRYRQQTALILRLPLANSPLLAAQILRGDLQEGVPASGRDYRDVPVIGLARAVPGTDWFLVTKEDRSELYGNALGEAGWIALAGLLALFMAGAGLVLLRQRQQLALAAATEQAHSERLQAYNLLAAVADSSDDAIFAQDLDGRYMLFNRAACRFVGKSAEQVLGRGNHAIFPPEQAQMLIDMERQVITENRPITHEERLQVAGGERVFMTTKGPLRDASGKVLGLFGIARDVTTRQAVEMALRESEARFRALVEQSLAGIYIVQDGLFRYANPGLAKMFGYARPEELLGTPLGDLVCPEDRARVAENIRRRLDKEISNIHYIFSAQRRDGSRIVVEVHGSVFDYEGRSAVIGLLLDITARKAAEDALRESEAQFRTLFETAAVSIIIHDCDSGEIVAANRRAIESYGYSRLEELQQNIFWLEAPYSAEDALALVRQAAQEGSQRFEWKNRGRNGQVFWEEVRLNRVNLNGTVRVLSIAVDITSRKAAEEALRRQSNELRRRNEELERFNHATVGRELEMIELKRQVNEMAQQLGQEPPYDLLFLNFETPEEREP